ncbi:hypothetical protein EV421DRAFT_1735658 [Armillaria borealis]|uniref:Uncharacterized protein n=1 Tax=Armillaria borealis TaxID=47425 RepID=A0AA39JKP0_9AGAR|nr:hypothetical protein EV421DRAFT_1735658 [Armillaria borealis]
MEAAAEGAEGETDIEGGDNDIVDVKDVTAGDVDGILGDGESARVDGSDSGVDSDCAMGEIDSASTVAVSASTVARDDELDPRKGYELLPSLDAEVLDPNKLHPSAWRGILRLALAKVDSSFYFQLQCKDHIVQLVKGSRAPAHHLRVRDESRDTKLELFIWAYLYSVANERVPDSPGLLNFVSSKALAAASTLVSAFTIMTFIDEHEPLPSSSNSSSTLGSASLSHVGDLDDDVKLSVLYRRRNHVEISDTVDPYPMHSSSRLNLMYRAKSLSAVSSSLWMVL